MVIVRLKGGLGNQLFQYAAARNLSILHTTTLKLDISYFERQSLRTYSLTPFRIQEEFATLEEIAKLKGISKKRLARIAFRLSQQLKPYYRRSIFSEPHLGPFDVNIVKTPRDVYLDGSWQSEKYFKDIEHVLRDEITVRYPLDSANGAITRLIRQTESVSLHVRRGDYVSNPTTYHFHGVCSREYYQGAVDILTQMVKEPHFFVFSDDIPWVQQNLGLDYPITYITHNGVDNAHEDLRLVRRCKHHIIANSSFSWWGAWLCTFPEKIVISPKKWFNAASLDTSDLIPTSWIQL